MRRPSSRATTSVPKRLGTARPVGACALRELARRLPEAERLDEARGRAAPSSRERSIGPSAVVVVVPVVVVVSVVPVVVVSVVVPEPDPLGGEADVPSCCFRPAARLGQRLLR